MNLLVLKKFNNYFNRIIKRYSDLDSYIATAQSFKRVADFNFNPNDGVRTEVVLGKGDLSDFFDFEKTSSADYLVAYNTVTENDQTFDVIDSRWFITEVKRTRAGQYLIQLKRDTIADYFNSLINCPAYIQKGICRDDNPLILNDEGIKVNQIKSGQDFLKDQTGSAWIVGYMPKGAGTQDAITAQVMDDTQTYETIENIATELGIEPSALSAVLTDDPGNVSSFSNDNVEIDFYEYEVGSAIDTYENSFCFTTQNEFGSFTKGEEKIVHIDNSWRSMKGNITFIKEVWWDSTLKSIMLAQCNSYRNQLKALWPSVMGLPYLPRSVYNKLNSLASKQTLLYKNGTYYRIKVGSISGPTTVHSEISALTSPLNTIISNTVSQYNTAIAGQAAAATLTNLNGGYVSYWYNKLDACFYLEEVANDPTVPGVTFEMSSTRNSCLDQTFDMFAIPFSNVPIKDGVNTYEGIGDYAQKLAADIAMKMPSDKELYDLQLLPYCPIDAIVGNNEIDITSLSEGYDYDWITYTGSVVSRAEQHVYAESNEYDIGQYEGSAEWQSDINDADIISWGYTAEAENQDQEAQEILRDWEATNSATKTAVGGKAKFMVFGQIQEPQIFDYADINVGFWVTYNDTVTNQKKSIVIYPKKSSFSRVINKPLSLRDSMKIENLCNKYRLVGPNYQGGFEFNIAKNNGYCSGFTAQCTYKPYTPYIRVVPNFNWMYGTNYDKEARGLVCNGDFSLGRVSDAWTEYQLQNKNYQNIFNRDIQNLDVNQSIQRQQAWATGGIGIVNAGVQGGVTGALAGGGVYGAVAGAALGATASAAGMAADIHLMEKGMQEQRQYSIDKFNMQLGNIQAIPYSLTKVSAFDIDSAIWPILEYYTCTPEEKEYLENKFRYEGYTIGVVDLLSNYFEQGNYVQAYLIRNTEITDDPHQLEDINNELLKGVYL